MVRGGGSGGEGGGKGRDSRGSVGQASMRRLLICMCVEIKALFETFETIIAQCRHTIHESKNELWFPYVHPSHYTSKKA